ncbi:family 43 glycosylhydrolase [Halalkalibacter flavus]|uniref:family 43 glycosylhydrolase n=1 Tax=Halalkalibacter flavus TaxID=3090668 RepID=UPI002FCB78E6
MKKWFLLFVLGGLLMTGCQSEEAKTYQNPVFEPVIADPSIVYAHDGYFYVYGTEDHFGDERGQPLIPIIRSKDLVEWEYVGEALEEKPEWKDQGFLWAPDIVHRNDKYYLYYAVSTWGDPDPGIGIAISENPEGPFEDLGNLFTSSEIDVRNSIDPMFYEYDGKNYLFWGSFHGIYGVELSEDGLEVTGEKFRVAGNAFEAPYIIERDGYFYFFASLGSCCEGLNSKYRVAVGRAESIEGPYLDKDGNDLLDSEGTLILKGESEEDSESVFVGPGHNAIITDDEGTDWIVYHAIERDKPYLPLGATRRPLMIDPIIWEDGWPTIKGSIPSSEPQKAPVFND